MHVPRRRLLQRRRTAWLLRPPSRPSRPSRPWARCRPPYTANTITPKQPLAFQLEEGQLSVEVDGESAQLIQGDVLFVPANTTFSYYATVPVTKFLYVSGGADGFDQDLLQNSVEWEYAAYPTYAGYSA